MSKSQIQRSTYRDRRIQLMLDQSAEDTVKNIPSSKEPLTQASTPTRRANHSLLWISCATAALCGLAIFFMLFRRETSVSLRRAPSEPAQAAPVPVKSPPPPVQSAPIAVPPPLQAKAVEPNLAAAPLIPAAKKPQNIAFTLRLGTGLERVGPLSLKLVSTVRRTGNCRIYIAGATSRATQRNLQVNRSIQVSSKEGIFNLLVRTVSYDSISGSLKGH